ncbi:MAG: insulinase family protein [Ideonella sp.]|nr:insulinase family protein [Ideonella sp.]
MHFRRALAHFVLAFAPLVAAAAAPPAPVQTVEGISEYRLDNGLQVLLVPDDSKPTTTVNLTFRVGSRHENYGETGMAHLLEHMMFKGSPRHPTVWAEFSKRGLRANGTTSYDRTNYFASFAGNADNLKWYLDWLADAMVNSHIARKDLDSEMTVVRNEMERGENDPQRIMWQRGMAALYDWHNYGKSTIGARSDVENVDIPRLQAFYRTYYQPDNATLVVSGAFDAAQTLAWVQEFFGRIPAPERKLPALYTLDPARDGERSYTVRRTGGVPMLLASYHAPAAAHQDYAAAEVLAMVLLDEPAGRLYQALVEKGLAASVTGAAWDLADPGAMMFGATLAPGQDVEAARKALLATLEGFAARPVTDEEVRRARTRWLNEWERRYTNPETVGVALSDAVGQGDWRLFFLLRDRVRGVTAADVQRLATTYLVPSSLVLGTYLPTERPQRAPAPARVDVAAAVAGYKGDPAVQQAEAFEATPANIDARTQRFDLASGMQVALLPKGTRGNAVHALLTLRYGDEKTLAGLGDIASFTAALLDRGTARLSRQQLQDRFEALAAQVQFGADATRLTVSIKTTRDKLPAVVALVGEVLREASLPDTALEEVRQQALADIESRRKEPEAVIEDRIERHGNPYPRGDVRHARSFDEMAADARAVQGAQLRDFHARFYGARHAQFAASGAMDPAAVRAALEAAFGQWAPKMAYTRVPTPLVAVAPERFVLVTPDKQNAAMAARLALPLSEADPDYATFTLANRILGQGGNSRLWKRIRETEGLSYDVGTGVAWNPHERNSIWQAWAIFAPESRGKVEKAFGEEIARALKDGFTQQELDEAKKGLLAARTHARAQDGVLASALANNLYLGRTFAVSQKVDEAVAAATLAEVNGVLRKYLKPEQLVIGFGGDFKAK